MDYKDFPFITMKGAVSEQNRQEYYAKNSAYLDEKKIALLRQFHTNHFLVSGVTQIFPEFIVSNDARLNLIYPIAFLILDGDEHYYTDRSDLNAYELRYTLEGEGYLEYNGKSYILRKGEGFFIDCRRHHFYRTNASHWKSTVFHFQGRLLPPLFSKYSERGNIKFTEASCPNFEMMQYEILKTTQKFLPYAEYKISCLFDVLLTDLLLGQEKVPQNSQTHSVIENMILYMKNHISEPMTIEQLSRQFGISSTHLNREFRKYTGFSPKEYLIQIRLNEAKRLLKTSSLSIDDIAAFVGFSDTAHFIQIFKKKEETTPLKYRKSERTL